MNIFYLDHNPMLAAQYHCDKHVVKMILESAQLLSTAHRVIDGQLVEGKSKTGRNVKRWKLNDDRENYVYQAGHVNHPSAVWVRSSIDHYRYLYELMYFLIEEYKYRYDNKEHKCEGLLHWLLNAPENIPIVSWEEPPQAMPDDCKVPGFSVAAYRKYYMNHKRDFANWKRRGQPNWYK